MSSAPPASAVSTNSVNLHDGQPALNEAARRAYSIVGTANQRDTSETRSEMTDSNSWKIEDDLALLRCMLGDASRQPKIYQPGKYWALRTSSAINDIYRFGLRDFRGRSNGIGLSYADKDDTDVRQSLNTGLRRPLGFVLKHVYPFKNAFEGQVRLTHRVADAAIREKSGWLNNSPRISQLVRDYIVPYSLGGGCVNLCDLNGQQIATHYLALLDSIDILKDRVDFANARTYFEIGGGFGINLHLLLSNYPGMKKCIYLDIPPNLYVGTQYLKSHFGSAVKDYASHRSNESIRFSDDDELEIICVAPWQVERLQVAIDIFHNAHSFVEMPDEVVANYAAHVERLLKKSSGAIALISYGNYDLRTTIHPDRLPSFFEGVFDRFERQMVTSPGSRNFFYVRGTAFSS